MLRTSGGAEETTNNNAKIPMAQLTANSPLMWAAPTTKPRINLFEYRFLEEATRNTAPEHMDAAIEAVRVYAKLHLNMCLSDEAAALRHRNATRPARRLQLA